MILTIDGMGCFEVLQIGTHNENKRMEALQVYRWNIYRIEGTRWNGEHDRTRIGSISNWVEIDTGDSNWKAYPENETLRCRAEIEGVSEGLEELEASGIL